ncbi:MAG: NAD-dependent epimerase/dehydratase family protein [Acetobacteraceae bacterium]|nr:NAD-dependent epimerase/dehydratase family protein [Acetobacteraceae bacterium]
MLRLADRTQSAFKRREEWIAGHAVSFGLPARIGRNGWRIRRSGGNWVADTILVTGGAGFIGRHVSHALLRLGHRVRVLDNLIEQVHGGRDWPEGLDPEVELLVGDVRDEAALIRALRGVDKVVHLAAEVGVGQSMYAVDRYVSANDRGTATLFQQLINRPVQRVVVASSMSIYGEGLYRDADGRLAEDVVRQPRSGMVTSWDPVDVEGRPLQPVPTPEWKRPALASVYAITKYVQERLTLTLAPAYGMEGVALRLWNVYGPGQALSNPYTGVLAIFASRLQNGQSPVIFEDGLQRRDFVHVEDVAQAFVLALAHPRAAGGVFNIASGQDRSVQEVAELLATAMGRLELVPEITGKARAGDIRHCIADIGLARNVLGYTARRDFMQGLAELAEWVARQQAEDRVQQARKELEARGLVA